MAMDYVDKCGAIEKSMDSLNSKSLPTDFSTAPKRAGALIHIIHSHYYRHE